MPFRPRPTLLRTVLRSLSGAMSLLALSACGLGGHGTPETRESQTPLAADALPGTWTTGCLHVAGGNEHGEKWKFEFTRESDEWSLTLRRESFPTSECSGTEEALDVELAQGAFARGALALDDATLLKMQPFSAIRIAQTESLVQARNSAKLCDHDDWSVGVPIEVTGTSCAETALAARTVVAKIVSEDRIELTTCQANDCHGLVLDRTSL